MQKKQEKYSVINVLTQKERSPDGLKKINNNETNSVLALAHKGHRRPLCDTRVILRASRSVSEHDE